MAATVGDFLLERLYDWGARRVFGYPGDGIVGAFGRQDKIEFIRTRHEELAAFMACAHAKLTGQAGVCLAASGAGAAHLLNGLYDARMDHRPTAAIVGQQKRAALACGYGLQGFKGDRPDDIGPAWEKAPPSSRPTVPETVTDPTVPPLPPHVSAKQAKAYLSSPLHGDPDSTRMVTASIKEAWDAPSPPDSAKE